MLNIEFKIIELLALILLLSNIGMRYSKLNYSSYLSMQKYLLSIS